MTRRRKLLVYARPVEIRYYAGARLGLNNWSVQGYALTPINAKRAAVVRLIIEQWSRAVIVDRYTGDILCTLTRTALGITVHQGEQP